MTKESTKINEISTNDCVINNLGLSKDHNVLSETTQSDELIDGKVNKDLLYEDIKENNIQNEISNLES